MLLTKHFLWLVSSVFATGFKCSAAPQSHNYDWRRLGKMWPRWRRLRWLHTAWSQVHNSARSRCWNLSQTDRRRCRTSSSTVHLDETQTDANANPCVFCDAKSCKHSRPTATDMKHITIKQSLAATSVCISVPLWQIRIFGLFFHAKSGYPDFIRIFCAGPYRPLWYGMVW